MENTQSSCINCAEEGLDFAPRLQLTDRNGCETQTGLFVVRNNDSLENLEDIDDHVLLLGSRDSDEKHKAPLKKLKEVGIEWTLVQREFAACSEAVSALLQMGKSEKAIAVISSYASPLLEGCGTVRPGELRVVGETEPVPFISVFVGEHLPLTLRQQIEIALVETSEHPRLLAALESLTGFIEFQDDLSEPKTVSQTRQRIRQAQLQSTVTASSTNTWPGFRGIGRDGIVSWLPNRLPSRLSATWTFGTESDGVGGIAANESCVVFGCRDEIDRHDLFHCLDTNTGRCRWTFRNLAPLGGSSTSLDYGNSARATPLITSHGIIVQSAFGPIHCLDPMTGEVRWTRDLSSEFGGPMPAWGFSSSPILVGRLLIVQPGAKEASIVALNVEDGETVWESPGNQAAYASPIVWKADGMNQIVAIDSNGVSAIETTHGKLLWRIDSTDKSFQVPSPVVANGNLFCVNEIEGGRIYRLDRPNPMTNLLANCPRFTPDVHTPIHVEDSVVGVHTCLYRLDDQTLAIKQTIEDPVFEDNCFLVSDGRKNVLAIGQMGGVVLLKMSDGKLELVDRSTLTSGRSNSLSHPAFAGTKLIHWADKTVVCYELMADSHQ